MWDIFQDVEQRDANKNTVQYRIKRGTSGHRAGVAVIIMVNIRIKLLTPEETV